MKKFTIILLVALVFSAFTASAQSPIFTEGYAPGVTFAAFGGSTNNLTEDATVAYTGTKSLKIEVTTGYTGGALVAAMPQNLSTYNAVSFWIKGSAAKTLNVAGLGNDAVANVFQSELPNIAVTTTWTKVVIPIPNPAKFTAVAGLFHFAEGSEEGAYTIWMDDIQYETTTVGTATAAMATETISKSIGDVFSPNGATCSFNGVNFNIMKAWFNYTSSNTGVATMNNATGVGTAVAGGTTNITATMGATAVTGTLTVNVTAAPSGPTVAAPTPTKPAADVISLFSNAYTDLAATDWFPNWGQSTVVTDEPIAGNTTKKFANLNYQGTQFASPINLTAAGMTSLHIDYWSSTVNSFDIFLINIPPLTQNEQKVTITPTSSGWNSIDIPLSSYSAINLTGIGQIKWEGRPSGGNVYLDNIYFFKSVVVPTAPTVAAPTPTRLPANVISLFSNAYTDLAATDWFPNWGQSTVVTDEPIAGNTTKKFANLNYQGTQFASAINLTTAGMTSLHIDYWSSTVNSFDIFLINIAPLAQAEQKVTITPTLSGWNSIDIPLSSYNAINLTGIGQIKWEGRPSGGDVYLDNIYFWKPVVVPTAPTVAAPTPTRLPANVISLFSNAYTDLAATDWFPNWGQSTVVTDEPIAGNTTKKFANLNYQGTQFASAINLTTAGMTTLHLDYWSSTVNSFDIFLINIAPLAQAEQKVTITPTLSGWNSIDIPLTSYNLVNLTGVGQIKWEGRPSGGDVYLDNIYFWKPVPTAPTVAAPTPTRLPADVISLFSNAYTDLAATDWFPNWGQSTVVTDEPIAGNTTKKFANINYQGTQFARPINLRTEGMTSLHIDYWSSSVNAFDVFLINIAPLAQAEQRVILTPTLSGWNSIDIPLSSYNLIDLAGIGQIKWEGRPSGGDVYLDNIYFWKPAVIPVELVNFKAKTSNTTTVLTWHTASERNNQGFTIERSANGTDFAAIGIVKGNGTTSTPQHYTFTDNTPSVGVNYYRLRQSDFDGKTTLSKVVSVILGKNGLVITNTLVHDALNVVVSDAEMTPLSIFNVSGQLVYSIKVQGTQRIDVSHLTAGVYIVRTASGEARRFVKD